MPMVVSIMLEVVDAEGNRLASKLLPPETWKQNDALFTNQSDVFLPVQREGLPEYTRALFFDQCIESKFTKRGMKPTRLRTGSFPHQPSDIVQFPPGSLRIDVEPGSELLNKLTGAA